MTQPVSQILKDLQSQAYTELAFPIPQATIQEAVNAFMAFLQQPKAIKQHIDFSISPCHRRGDVGYKHRDPENRPYSDSKEFFHFHPELFHRYEAFIEQHPVLQDFVTRADVIWRQVYKTVLDTLKVLDQEFAGLSTQVFQEEPVHILLRFLKYEWQQSGKHLATPHYDAGSFTLALAESCPGLRVGKSPESLQPIKHKEQTALFMLSSNFQTLEPESTLPSGWHDVIQLDESKISQPFSRWAVVAFIEAHGIPAKSRAYNHEWGQVA